MMKNKNLFVVGIVLLFCIAVGYYFVHEKQVATQAVIDGISQDMYGDIVIGDEAASKRIILFFDYNCTFCQKFFNDVFPELDTNYIQTGKIKLVLKLVCSVTDRKALEAYQTAICIDKYGNFQKLHNLLLHKNEIIYTEHFSILVEDYIAASEELGDCIVNSNFEFVIHNIYQLQQLNTKGTPTFVVGDKILNGFVDYNSLIKNIN